MASLRTIITFGRLAGENGHVDHPKTEYTDQLFSFA
jgi:hypothetical protein